MKEKALAATESVAAFFLLVIALLVATNVILRGAFGITLPDWYDGSRLLLAVSMCWGIAIATFRGSHICVDILWENCSEKNRRRIDALASVFVVALLLPMMWMTWVKTAGTGSQVTADLRIPLAPFFGVAAAGLTAAAVLAIARAVLAFKGRAGQEQQP